jgi:photosynthetic reaction center cytochrome c subunit
MVREINNEFIASTADDLPADRKGPLGDPLKAGCNTCHQGAYKPLFGVAMAPDYPALLSKMSTTPRPVAPVEATPAADAPSADDASAPADGAAAAEG